MSWRTRAVEHRVGYWPLSGDAADYSGYGNDGTLVNAPTWAQTPWGSQCVELDGNNAHVNLGDLTYLNSVGAFTICFWMNQDVLDAYDFTFKKRLNGSNSIQIYNWTDGNMRCVCANAGLAQGLFDYSTVISAASWHHLAMVFDGSQTGDANRLIVYVDGVPVTLTFDGAIPAVTADLSGVDARIGDAGLTFDGKLADFSIFNVALTRDEVAAVMRGR